MKELIGTGVALITPFTQDLKVDTAALEKLVNYQAQNGIDYLVVLGTTAESATLTNEEKQLVIDTVVKANNGRLPLVLGMGGNNTAALVEELKSTDLKDFAAILSVSPYYNKPTQEGIYQHYKALAQVAPKPIVLYNVPGRTASNVLPATVKRLAQDFPNIIGIKEAAGDIVQAMKLIDQVPERFLVISGDDMITLPMVLAGGHGVISVIAQGFPKEFSDMVRLGLDGKVKEAYKLHYKVAPSIDMIFAEGNPGGIKSLLHKKGICENELRLPLVKASDKLYAEIEGFVNNF
ncbi:4-hydroxy-tetrahydrodipicolinate synthase [Antarcticibacterium flavum]|uniref:4-hydroxy-tetrahydrodipicolinate synthase n=1 Tax=Antarcticibacterium flavum TaxID=2058175 RepID=A0A5B7X717_9FLAO|nr:MULTISPECIES: 4-hydroxy-tetrahydrodipicolinate synthase [Antarcticibacterium]MCM4161066.1 4-hydroxy-tetrahydrodipicolinate synthase [Antarcticibacterium sp. W02-3]QCY70508.1 4-hydroxy-tetrahydrodipicolinate synthase [Antarcticibacterium flavum]